MFAVYVALGCVPIGLYWLFAYRLNHKQRQAIVWSLVTATILFGAFGAAHELITTGALGAPPGLD